MGYRSQVTSAVIFADTAHNTKAMVAWKLHCAAEKRVDPLNPEQFGEYITFPVIGGRWPCILLTNKNANDWKWYEGYEDVDAWHHFIEWMHEHQDAYTVFLRVGEDDDDVVRTFDESSREDMQDFWAGDFFGITREIRIDI